MKQDQPRLALRFYGVPSRCMSQKRSLNTSKLMQHGSKTILSPLLLTVPLEYHNEGRHSSRYRRRGGGMNCDYDDMLMGLLGSPPSPLGGAGSAVGGSSSMQQRKLVHIYASSDWRIGIAVIRRQATTEDDRHHDDDDDSRGGGVASWSRCSRLVLFPLPRSLLVDASLPSSPPSGRGRKGQRADVGDAGRCGVVAHDDSRGRLPPTDCVQVWKCDNISMAREDSHFTLRKFLWKVSCIPCSSDPRTDKGHVDIIDAARERHQQSCRTGAYANASVDEDCRHGHDIGISLATHVIDRPGYLYIIDDEEGFRLLWITDAAWRCAASESACMPRAMPSLTERPSSSSSSSLCFRPPDTRRIIRRIVSSDAEDGSWESFMCERQSGCRIDVCSDDEDDEEDDGHGDCAYSTRRSPASTEAQAREYQQPRECGRIDLSYEANLSVVELLVDILDRRRNLVPGYESNYASSIPNYAYELIGVQNSGTALELVLAFRGGKRRQTFIGVVVRISLFTQEYEELKWVKNPAGGAGTTATATSLSKWSNKLAVNWRMRQGRAGPYRIVPDHPYDWGSLCKPPMFDLSELDDCDPSLWEEFVELAESKRTDHSSDGALHKLPTRVSFATLYPDCDVVDNKAVISLKPVLSIKCRSPMELIYG